MTIAELRKRSNSFVSNLDVILGRIVTDNEALEELNKQQLRASKLANDQRITPDYKPSYSNWKHEVYPGSWNGGRVNLFLTGDLYKNMEITYKGDQYEILSLLPYVAKLEDKYGSEIFGIAPSNQQKAQQITTTLLSEEFKKQVL